MRILDRSLYIPRYPRTKPITLAADTEHDALTVHATVKAATVLALTVDATVKAGTVLALTADTTVKAGTVVTLRVHCTVKARTVSALTVGDIVNAVLHHLNSTFDC